MNKSRFGRTSVIEKQRTENNTSYAIFIIQTKTNNSCNADFITGFLILHSVSITYIILVIIILGILYIILFLCHAHTTYIYREREKLIFKN